ncbi:MAG TPA: YceI family protein [Rhodanobacteraceae bacterium]|nr:YceI family protein [Rhodanobacteraceae bacterium]
MKSKVTRIGALLLLLWASAASARDWKVDAAHSTLTFTGTYQGEKFEGRFKRFDARIAYDPANLAQSKFDVDIDIASVDTANTERDQALPGKPFFDTAQFPRAHFVTTRFRKAADGRVFADGTLSLRGVSKPVTLAVTFAQAGNGGTLDVQTTLKRLDFGIGSGDWADTSMIGNAVMVRGHLLLQP